MKIYINVMDEFDKMINGKIYDPNDKKILKLRQKAHKICLEYNKLDECDSSRNELIKELLGQKTNAFFQGPIYFDYGINFKVGKNFYANFNFTCLDVSIINIGNNVFVGPNCSIVTPMHPFLYSERNLYVNDKNITTDKEYSKPITIGSNCWLASNVTIIGGVNIGEGCVIGAGSVVTKDIPPFSLAAGNPCKVIRKIDENDSIYLKKNLF